MKDKTIAIWGLVISIVGALDAIGKLLKDIGNWFNTLPPVIQWGLIILVMYLLYKRSK